MPNSLNSDEVNQQSLQTFNQFVEEMKKGMLRDYSRAINRELSRQQPQQLLQRTTTQIMQQSFDQALAHLTTLEFDRKNVEVNNGFSELSVAILDSFDGLFDRFLQGVIQHHRGSCALSNFPEEHDPSPEYIHQTIEQVGRQWQNFAIAVNAFALEGNQASGTIRR